MNNRPYKKKSKFIKIGSILGKMINHIREEKQDHLAEICKIWRDTIDNKITDQAFPAAIKGSILMIHVSSSVWIHELRFQKKNIITQMNSNLGSERIKDIQFKIGH